MKIYMYGNSKRGRIWIVHSQKFKPKLDYLLYTHSEQRLEFIFMDGTKRDLGAYVNESLQPHFNRFNEVMLVHVMGKIPVGFDFVPLYQKERP